MCICLLEVGWFLICLWPAYVKISSLLMNPLEAHGPSGKDFCLSKVS